MMKPRKVVVTVEMVTGQSVADLKFLLKQTFPGSVVKQIQVNVIKDKT
jgi:hypothetical protein